MPSTRKAGPNVREMKVDISAAAMAPGIDLVERLKLCPPTMTLADAARLLDKDRVTLWRATRRKEDPIPTVNYGTGEVLIDTALWIRYIEMRNPHIAEIRRVHHRRFASAAAA